MRNTMSGRQRRARRFVGWFDRGVGIGGRRRRRNHRWSRPAGGDVDSDGALMAGVGGEDATVVEFGWCGARFEGPAMTDPARALGHARAPMGMNVKAEV